jgi:hypothetical protein
MINLLVSFEYETLGSESLPEDQRTGVGAVDVSVERLPETIEEFREIARTIGKLRTPEKTEDYKSVNILQIAVLDKIIPDSGEVLEGEIVI